MSDTNKVTPQQIDTLLQSCEISACKVGKKTTCVTATLPNGFEITETSSCVDPANYDQAIGTDICLNRIKDKLWELEGYKLQCELNAPCEKPDDSEVSPDNPLRAAK